MFIPIPDCDDMDKAKEDNEQCKDALEAMIDSKDMYDCGEIKEVCQWVSFPWTLAWLNHKIW